jgi:hypothetical protein
MIVRNANIDISDRLAIYGQLEKFHFLLQRMKRAYRQHGLI